MPTPRAWASRLPCCWTPAEKRLLDSGYVTFPASCWSTSVASCGQLGPARRSKQHSVRRSSRCSLLERAPRACSLGCACLAYAAVKLVCGQPPSACALHRGVVVERSEPLASRFARGELVARPPVGDVPMRLLFSRGHRTVLRPEHPRPPVRILEGNDHRLHVVELFGLICRARHAFRRGGARGAGVTRRGEDHRAARGVRDFLQSCVDVAHVTKAPVALALPCALEVVYRRVRLHLHQREEGIHANAIHRVPPGDF